MTVVKALLTCNLNFVVIKMLFGKASCVLLCKKKICVFTCKKNIKNGLTEIMIIDNHLIITFARLEEH